MKERNILEGSAFPKLKKTTIIVTAEGVEVAGATFYSL
jgi:hypothetical protein